MNTKQTMSVLALVAAFACLDAALAGTETPVGGATAKEQIAQDDVPIMDGPPVALKTVPPVYPASARKRGREGTVYVQAFVNKSGVVGKVRVPAGKGVSPDLDSAAVRAVRRWTFKPATASGKPTGTWIAIPVKFVLK